MTPPCAAALAELVALEDLKREAEALHFAGAQSGSGEGWYPKYEAMRKDYIKRHAPAWEAARAVLAADKLQTEDQGQSVPLAPDASLIDSPSIDAFVRHLLWGEHPECCGRPVVGAEYMGSQEMVCCGNPEPSLLNDAQIVASLRERFQAPPK